MFKNGDIVYFINTNFINTKYKKFEVIGGILERYTLRQVNEPNNILFVVPVNQIKLDITYMRKQKLKKICSKIRIR